MSEQEFSPEDEEIARQLVDQLKELRVEGVVIQTLVNVSAIGYRCLGLTEESKEDRDLEQTRLAIETMRAVTPVLEQVVPADLVRDFNQSVANLQLAYAKAAAEEGAAPEGDGVPADESDDKAESAADEVAESEEDESA